MDTLASTPKMAQLPAGTPMTSEMLDARRIRLTARDVTVHYGTKQALHGISIDIPSHAVTSFIGSWVKARTSSDGSLNGGRLTCPA